MTDALIKIQSNSGKKMFNFYIRSRADESYIKEMVKDFATYSDNDSIINGGRLNWDFLSTNFLRFLMENYKNRTTINCDQIKIVDYDEMDNIINTFIIKPNADKYKNINVSLFDALEITSI